MTVVLFEISNKTCFQIAFQVSRLLDILKSSHDNPGHYASSDWPPIEDFNQSDIIWGQCVDDVIDDYDVCDPEYEKL